MVNCRMHKCVCKPITLPPPTTLSTISSPTSNNPLECIEGRPCLSHQSCGVTVGSGICNLSTKKCMCKPTTVECMELFPCASDANCGENGWCNHRGRCRCPPTTPTPPMQCQWGSSCSANEDCGAVGVGVCDLR